MSQNCYPHLVRREGAPTEAPPATGIHWIDITTGMEYFSVGTTSVADWLPRSLAIKESLYCNQIAEQTGISNVDTVLLFDNEAQNTNIAVMNCSVPGEIEINRLGKFEFDLRITADTQDNARRSSETRLQRDTGSGFNDIPLSEGSPYAYGYHRNNASGENTASSKIILDVNIGDKFRYIIKTINNGLIKTVPRGTSLTVKQI